LILSYSKDFSGKEFFTVDHGHPLFSFLLTKNFLKISRKIQNPANVSPTTVIGAIILEVIGALMEPALVVVKQVVVKVLVVAVVVVAVVVAVVVEIKNEFDQFEFAPDSDSELSNSDDESE